MEEKEQSILEPILSAFSIKRRKLIPVWIKIFIWLFFLITATVPLAIIFGISGKNFKESLYGLESTDPFSIVGIVITFLFLFKGFVSYSLWFEKDWAIELGTIDAIIGLLICVYLMIFPQYTVGGGIRLEIAILIPYLVKLQNIKAKWKLADK